MAKPSVGLPSSYEPVDDATRTMRFDDWSKTLYSFAKSICDDAPDKTDERGHDLRPCARCVKIVRHITELWFWVLMRKYQNLSEQDEVPFVPLDGAYFMAAAILEPEVSVAIPEWGPA